MGFSFPMFIFVSALQNGAFSGDVIPFSYPEPTRAWLEGRKKGHSYKKCLVEASNDGLGRLSGQSFSPNEVRTSLCVMFVLLDIKNG
ncbi:hypothetical protein Syun_031856 [Stephania yunnanensis]|uniref:Uncharacterized protein n=1 Tax=Stephania yunnanensis TaxID=152371 RepID=A0AAP0E0F4_9MAGN